LQQRYEAISSFLQSAKAAIFAPFDYQPQGILVSGGWRPIVKMGWVTGDTLDGFIEAHLGDTDSLGHLATQFRGTVLELRKLQMAHGDLQHGNMVVTPARELKLIDYDGMYVLGMPVGRSHEKGHVNYQHPQRDASHFGPDMDRFSSIVIYLSIMAVAENPSLWSKYYSGENLIFGSQDFADPDNSRLFGELRSSGTYRSVLDDLARLCAMPISRVPTLEDLLSGRFLPSGTVMPTHTRAVAPRQYELVLATDRDGLLKREGSAVEVVGKVQGCRRGQTRFGKPYLFLNFGDWRYGCFYLVFWTRGLERLTARGLSETDLVGKWLSVTGLIETYCSRKAPKAPQIVIDNPAVIRTISQSEAMLLCAEAVAGSPDHRADWDGQAVAESCRTAVQSGSPLAAGKAVSNRDILNQMRSVEHARISSVSPSQALSRGSGSSHIPVGAPGSAKGGHPTSPQIASSQAGKGLLATALEYLERLLRG